MKKSTRIVKRLLALFLVVLMSINSFAAVVGDNDGAAFITKAEFDSLKNNFQSQIDQYNTSIDSKIDGAIAAYLAGLQIDKHTSLKSSLDNNGKLSNGKYLYWNSSDSSYFGDTSGERFVVENLQFAQYFKIGQNGNRYVYSYLFENCNNHDGSDWSVSKRNYLTSYEKKLTLNDGTKVDGYQRTRVMVRLVWNFIEMVPFYNYESHLVNGWDNNSGATEISISSNKNNIKQNTANLFAYRHGGSANSQWFSETVIYIYNDDNGLLDTDNFERLCPLSSANEYYWDKTDTTSTIIQSRTAYQNKWTWGTQLKWNMDGVTDRYYGGTQGANMHGMYEANWLKHTTTVNEQYLETLNNVDNHNRKVKNGLVLGYTQGDADYYLNVNASEEGKLYVYVGKTAISNWTESSYSGLSFDITEKDKNYLFDLGQLSGSDNPIWICYLPTDDTKDALLKIIELYMITS